MTKKNQIVTVVIVTIVTVTVVTVVIVTSFSKNHLTPQQLMKYSQDNFSGFTRCFSLDPRFLGPGGKGTKSLT